jgi:hypothetical protein
LTFFIKYDTIKNIQSYTIHIKKGAVMQESIVLGDEHLPFPIKKTHFEEGSISLPNNVFGVSTCPACGARGCKCKCGVEKKWNDRKTGRQIIMKNIRLCD